MATLTKEREESAPASHSDYRAHLDGLRAIAVFLVVAFHAEIAKLSGGFIGVDVFFVLSGYLVTQLLLRDLGSFDHIRLRRFYARRYRRLLPAAFAALVVSAIGLVFVGSALEISDSRSAFRAAFLYFANWHFIRQGTDYFAADIGRSPVIHFWSLAIEEQFYLVWPLLLAGLFAASRRLGPRRVALVRVAVVLGALASVLAARHFSTSDLNRAYYGTARARISCSPARSSPSLRGCSLSANAPGAISSWSRSQASYRSSRSRRRRYDSRRFTEASPPPWRRVP